MKNFIILFSACLITFSTAYAQNCNTPVSAIIFQSNFNQIAAQNGNQLKLNKAIQFSNANCLTAMQVKSIASLFSDDAVRLEYCKVAYLTTSDKTNFYDVYDAFTSFSNAFRLHDYVSAIVRANTTSTSTSTTTSTTNFSFPNYAYPSISNYNGNSACNSPLTSDLKFGIIASNVHQQPTDESKVLAITQACDQNCLTMTHLMKLTSTISSDNLKLKVLMDNFSKIYDQDHYQSAIVLFSTTSAQNQWTTYASTYLKPVPAPVPVCETSDEDVNAIIKSMKAAHFGDDKFSTLELASKNRCFNVEQIRKISKEMTFGKDKLKVFKLLYAKCNNKDDYFKLLSELTFNSEKDDLSNFIKNDGK